MTGKVYMMEKKNNPFASLERVFHEPGRLAIMSMLIGAKDGLTFNKLKEDGDFTDGNLSRHIKTLEEAGAVKIKKEFVGSKPCTTVFITESGKAGFIEYLDALEDVLKMTAATLPADKKKAGAKGDKRMLRLSHA